ncbi:MAG: MarR family transcriptional regulator [Variovorax sp.]|nr:MAG: MarR family transcriptional regulator [Variovorax sp.]
MTTKAHSSPHGTLAWLACVRAYNLCEAVMTARLAELGLRVGEHEVLATIATTPGITQQALAARCFVAKSGVSMLIAQMEARGWVLRESDGADARVKRLSLTPEGLAIAQRTLAVQADVIRAMVGGASEADLATVARVMDTASEALEAMRAAPPPETTRARSGKAK